MDEQSDRKSSWMDAAFALDELHSDPHFREMAALIDDLQRRKVLPLSSLPDAETISSFLDEMELLEAVELESRPAAAPTARKKKLTSTERRKRDRGLLMDSVAQLQLQLDDITAERQLAQQEYWSQHSHELRDMEQKLRRNFQARHAVAREEGRTVQAAVLLQQMSSPMKNLTYTDANPGLQNDPMQDAAVYERLQRNIAENYVLLAHEWEVTSFPEVTSEAVDASVSSDGGVMSYKSARYLPFNVEAINATIWRVAQTGLQTDSCKAFFQLDSDTVAIKEQLTIHPAGHQDVTLCVRVAIRRIVKESHSIFMWETVCDWSTPSSTQTSRTQESGWLTIRPVSAASSCSSSPMSVLQSFMKMTLIESSTTWVRLMHNSGVMLPMIVPSSHQVMLSRIQHVENCLLDDSHARS